MSTSGSQEGKGKLIVGLCAVGAAAIYAEYNGLTNFLGNEQLPVKKSVIVPEETAVIPAAEEVAVPEEAAVVSAAEEVAAPIEIAVVPAAEEVA